MIKRLFKKIFPLSYAMAEWNALIAEYREEVEQELLDLPNQLEAKIKKIEEHTEYTSGEKEILLYIAKQENEERRAKLVNFFYI